MDAIEKRARELYAQALRANGMEFSADRVGDMVESGAAGSQRAVLDSIIAALTPPEGYVLVPVEPTPAMIDAPLVMDSPTNDGTRRTWAYMLAARPEVP